ncbi:MAG: hypothetical protein KHF84_07380 [Thermoplasmata archaeon]|nr:hypothetical protein [Candidatus Sysuiplasma jiujiangense]
MSSKREAKPLMNISAWFNSRKAGIETTPSMETMVGELKRLERSASVEIYSVDSKIIRRRAGKF